MHHTVAMGTSMGGDLGREGGGFGVSFCLFLEIFVLAAVYGKYQVKVK